jgi:cytochrome c-type biogenesis protein CcmH
MKSWLLAAILLMGALRAFAEPPLEFSSDGEEQRFRHLVAELRCVMCQNQSLADSDAQIAHDLRKQVLAMIRDGKSNDEIKQFLVVRYTDFVLYQPEVKPMTWGLWFGPALLVIAGGIVITVLVRRRSVTAPAEPPSDESQEW